MNESELEDYFANASKAVQEKNALLEQRYGLGHFGRWDQDGDLQQLTFSNPDHAKIIVAETTTIGSYSLKSKTWLWAWANESLSEAERQKAEPLKELFEVTGMRIFSDPHFDCDEYLAWELAAASTQHLKGIGCYRGPSGHLWIFWCMDSIKEGRRAM